MAISPASITIPQNGNGSVTITTATTSGVAQTIALSVSALPGNCTANFTPSSILSGTGSVLNISVGNALAGTYTVTVNGQGTFTSHTDTFTLIITASDFSI